MGSCLASSVFDNNYNIAFITFFYYTVNGQVEIFFIGLLFFFPALYYS